MTESSFYGTLRKRSDGIWQAIFSHPFVRGIGDGTLSRERYAFFLKQDYVYLIDFSRVFSLAATKAKALDDMRYFSELLHATLSTEMALHRKTCAALGIPEADLERTEPSLITIAYTNLLVRTCYEGALREIVTVLLPCAVGYVEIAQRLRQQGLPEDPFYQDWIHTYAADEFVQFADWLIRRADLLAVDTTETARDQLYFLYRASARFEYLFFDMSWKMDTWPEAIDT